MEELLRALLSQFELDLLVAGEINILIGVERDDDFEYSLHLDDEVAFFGSALLDLAELRLDCLSKLT